MKNIMLALLVLVGLTGAVTPREPHAELVFACETLQIECKGISRPTVIVTDLMGAIGLYGAYMPGEHWIFIDPQAPDHTYIHELTHYILHEAGFRFRDGCTSEEAARIVAAAWMGVDYSDKWRKQYGCAK